MNLTAFLPLIFDLKKWQKTVVFAHFFNVKNRCFLRVGGMGGAIKYCSWVLLGASWPQDPANLVPVWLILAAFWAHPGSILVLPGPAKNGQSGFQTQLGAKMAPDRPQDRPQTPLDVDFSYVWGPFF